MIKVFSYYSIIIAKIIFNNMSILRQVSWQQFTKIIGRQEFYQFIEAETVVVLFVAEWSFPSRLALKRIKKMHFDKKKCGIVDVDLVDSIDLIQQHDIATVPYCMLFKNGLSVQQFQGFRVEQFSQVFSPLLTEQQQPKIQKTANCPSGHPLALKQELPFQLYAQGYFYCNSCKKIQKCSPEKPVANCQLCDYDLCIQCQSTQ